MNVQYKKGVLELCILSMLMQKDRSGYDISEALSRHIDISDGTVYPILRKLKTDGLVTTYLCEESGGPPRKYYAVTNDGRAEYRRALAEWRGFTDAVNNLLDEKE